MTDENAHLQAFDADHRQAGESRLAWVHARAGGGEGVVILTDRRIAFCAAGEPLESVPVTGQVLRYAPAVEGDTLTARFETDAGPFEFAVVGDEERGHFGNFLGNLAELREAQAKLEKAGLDPLFVSPPREPGQEGVSAIYQLIRLKEMLNQGLFSEIEFALQRVTMIDRFRQQAEQDGGPPNSLS